MYTPWADRQTPPLGRHPTWADIPLARHLQADTPQADTPQSGQTLSHPDRHLPWADTPPGQTPPMGRHPLGRHPLSDCPQVTCYFTLLALYALRSIKTLNVIQQLSRRKFTIQIVLSSRSQNILWRSRCSRPTLIYMYWGSFPKTLCFQKLFLRSPLYCNCGQRQLFHSLLYLMKVPFQPDEINIPHKLLKYSHHWNLT